MINFIGLIRAKNEARWIGEAIESLLPLCDRVFVMDDHSTDGTPDIAAAYPQVDVLLSQWFTLNESRDKTWLCTKALATGAKWAIMIDGDEILEAQGPDKILRHISTGDGIRLLSFPIPYYWDSTHTVRTDGSFSKQVRKSAFKISELSDQQLLFWNNGYAKGGLHCGNIPVVLLNAPNHALECALWHYGYFDAETRMRKHEWYTSVDSGNRNEDYHHIIQGDPGGPPADEVLRYAGPLVLEDTAEYAATHHYSMRPRETHAKS